MTLTPEDIQRLEAPLPLEHHEARAKGKNKAGNQQQWLIYITQEGVIPLLNSVDPSWTWDVRESSKWDKYAVVTGRLTIKDVFRDGRGGNSPNSANASTDEDTEKGAETDALKRAAVKFGVGLYLRGVPAIWLPYSDNNKPWEDEKIALDKFADWYKREFGAQNGKQAATPPQRQQNAPARPADAQESPVYSRAAMEAHKPLPVPKPTASPSSTPNGKPDGGGSPDLLDQLFPPQVDGAVVVELPSIGSIDMKALGKRAFDEKLVHGQKHFGNLINKMREEGWIRDAMNADQVLEAMRKREAEKDLAQEGVGK